MKIQCYSVAAPIARTSLSAHKIGPDRTRQPDRTADPIGCAGCCCNTAKSNYCQIDFFPFDLRTKKVIPSQSISIIDVRTAQDHVLAPRGSRDLISRSSHFFLADEEGPRGVVDRWDGPTGPGFGSHGTGMIAQLERARGHINVTLN